MAADSALTDAARDAQVRIAAFAFLEEHTERRGEVLPRSLLAKGFEFHGERVPLMGPQGIFKPRLMELPLSITTVPVVEGRPRPYDDNLDSEGVLKYRYRGTNPSHPDNEGLRRVMLTRTPLVYFHGIVAGEYLASWPAFVEQDDRAGLTFSVAIDSRATGVVSQAADLPIHYGEDRRRYITGLTQRRIHQEEFRKRVLNAYRDRCAVCSLRHAELLDAAHILPDRHERGWPIVSNGLALCKLHHAAFDRHILGVRPDCVIEIRLDILHEVDGPMLKHGLQGFEGKLILLPRSEDQRPNRQFLEERYGLFRKAS